MKPRVKQFAPQFPAQLTSWHSVLLIFCVICAGQVGRAQQTTPAKPSADLPGKAQPPTATNALGVVSQTSIASTATPLSALSNLGLRKSLASPAFKEVSETEDSSLPNGATQGIKVHGHWVIDVKNPDGTLAAHREFENSLTGPNQGQLLLGGLLSGYYVAGDYAIQLGTSICAGAGKCSIIASQSGEPGSYLCTQGECFATLKYTYNLAPTTGNQIDAYMVMSGSAVPDETGTLDTVSTVYNVCDFTNGYTGSGAPVLPTGVTSVAPASCIGTNNSAFISTFTSTTVTPSISITSGQVISVTVTISFS
jgi:hypothetical protein